jgi:hypothetical protein
VSSLLRTAECSLHTISPNYRALLQHVVVLNLAFSNLQDKSETSAIGVSDAAQERVCSAAVTQAEYAKQVRRFLPNAAINAPTLHFCSCLSPKACSRIVHRMKCWSVPSALATKILYIMLLAGVSTILRALCFLH